MKFFERDYSTSNTTRLNAWVCSEPEFKRNTEHQRYILLMITPGAKNIDYSKILYFGCDYGHERHRKNINELIFSGHNLIFVPDSLTPEDTLRLADFLIEKAYKYCCADFRIVCESGDKASQVKRIIYAKYMNKLSEGKNIFNIMDFYISVDPKYYELFIRETPNNYNFYHRYDHYSSYAFHRKEIISLRGQMDIAIRTLKEHSGSLDYSQLWRLLSGDFPDSDELFMKYRQNIKEFEDRLHSEHYAGPKYRDCYADEECGDEFEAEQPLQKVYVQQVYTCEDGDDELPF